MRRVPRRSRWGGCVSRCPHQAPGQRYSVHAGAYRVVVLGTVFDVAVDEDGVSVEVESGTVEVQEAADERPLQRLTAGSSWSSGHLPAVAPPAPSRSVRRAVRHARPPARKLGPGQAGDPASARASIGGRGPVRRSRPRPGLLPEAGRRRWARWPRSRSAASAEMEQHELRRPARGGCHLAALPRALPAGSAARRGRPVADRSPSSASDEQARRAAGGAGVPGAPPRTASGGPRWPGWPAICARLAGDCAAALGYYDLAAGEPALERGRGRCPLLPGRVPRPPGDDPRSTAAVRDLPERIPAGPARGAGAAGAARRGDRPGGR